MRRQTVLPFKLETTRDVITRHAGLALVGGFAVGLGLNRAPDRDLPKPGSGAGYSASEFVFPLVLISMGAVDLWKTSVRSGWISRRERFSWIGEPGIPEVLCGPSAQREEDHGFSC